MLITTACEQCSTTFNAASFAARYCSRRCQQQAYRARKKADAEQAEASQENVTVQSPPAVEVGFVEAATLAELRTIHREASTAGQVALVLARRIDRIDQDVDVDSAGGLASLSERHARAMERALMTHSGAQPSRPDADNDGDEGGDPVAQLQEARERRRRRTAAQR